MAFIFEIANLRALVTEPIENTPENQVKLKALKEQMFTWLKDGTFKYIRVDDVLFKITEVNHDQ